MADEARVTELKRDHPVRIFLQPIATPWVLGLFGFSVAAFVMGGRYAGWFSGAGADAMMYMAFAALLGGFTQLLAAMWGFKARDALSTAFNGIWGAFWLAVGCVNLSVAPAIAAAGSPGGLPMGFWFIPMTFITASCAAVALSHSKSLFTALTILTAACVLMAIGLLGNGIGIQIVGGWLFAISTAFAWYNATVALIAASYAKVPVEQHEPINEGLGEPGVVHDLGASFPRVSLRRKAVNQ